MLALAPNVDLLRYLKNVEKITPDVEAKLKAYMEVGYINQLNFQRNDGSFGYWGKSDTYSSTWLTAFVMKYLAEATPYVFIDDYVISSAMQFLMKNQDKDGKFNDIGRSINGANGEPVALTAYILIALKSVSPSMDGYVNPTNIINQAAKYIATECSKDEFVNPYSLALTAYALQLMKHEKKDAVLLKLLKLAKKQDGLVWWEVAKKIQTPESINYFYPIDIETTAYGLLAATEAGDDTNAFLIMKWLLARRNSNGGFRSSQDTVVSIQALTKLGEKLSSKDLKMDITITDNANDRFSVQVNPENALVQQNNELSQKATQVTVTASGTGFSVAQVSYKYYVIKPDVDKTFIVEVIPNSSTGKNYLNFEICAKLNPDEQARLTTNMAVMEISFPSGFSFNVDTLPSLNNVERVRVREKNLFLEQELN
jgi:CD109 antigen